MNAATRRDLLAGAAVGASALLGATAVRAADQVPEPSRAPGVGGSDPVPGDVARSHNVDGVAESVVKSKKYLIPMTILAPEVTGGVVVAYLADGRLKLPKGTPEFNIGDEEDTDQPDAEPAREPLVPATLAPAAVPPTGSSR